MSTSDQAVRVPPPPHELRFKPDVLKIMAEPLGTEAYRYGHHGQPNMATVTQMESARVAPVFGNRYGSALNKTVGTFIALHAERTGLPWWEAARDLCDLVPVGADEAESQDAA